MRKKISTELEAEQWSVFHTILSGPKTHEEIMLIAERLARLEKMLAHELQFAPNIARTLIDNQFEEHKFHRNIMIRMSAYFAFFLSKEHPK
jgi:hypothetical protein